MALPLNLDRDAAMQCSLRHREHVAMNVLLDQMDTLERRFGYVTGTSIPAGFSTTRWNCEQ